MRASYPDKSQTEGTTGLTTHKHYGAAVQTDRAECRHSQVMVPRQTTGPNHTNFACNSIGRRFNKASKRCNSNTAKPWFEIVEGELHAKLVKKTEKARGHGAWPGFEPTRRAKLAARPASGPDGARNTGGAASRNTGGAASRNSGGPPATSSTNDSGPAPQ